jgi:hypothetical protein
MYLPEKPPFGTSTYVFHIWPKNNNQIKIEHPANIYDVPETVIN